MSEAEDRAELIARLTLLAMPGLSASAVLRLLERHGSARVAVARLRAVDGIAGAARAELVRERAEPVRERVERAVAALNRHHIHVIAWSDPLYPEPVRLRLGEHAPPFLFARGRLELLRSPAIAVVGCRRASAYGLDMAEQIGSGIARAGGCVVSGLARGIDAAAHAAALAAGGATIAVLGCGIDVHYPRENRALQDRIARDGLLLSELMPGEPPRRYQFPHRNRIIAALGRAVVVVEAGARSGALTTGNHAASQGAQVYCVPNALHEPNLQGSLALLRDGASVYTGLRDLLETTGLVQLGAAAPEEAFDEAPPADRVHACVWRALGSRALHADSIAHAAGLPPTAALVALLELELDGRVRQLAGQRFERRRPLRRSG
ncbi:MAG TPA: DNA-processing protein DprA [Longimicrobiales bacterium]